MCVLLLASCRAVINGEHSDTEGLVPTEKETYREGDSETDRGAESSTVKDAGSRPDETRNGDGEWDVDEESVNTEGSPETENSTDDGTVTEKATNATVDNVTESVTGNVTEKATEEVTENETEKALEKVTEKATEAATREGEIGTAYDDNQGEWDVE